mmetsp:Transcript_18368/g.51007  ORF Transcript_18368/g.51007 Transcript_18368/m.51007 type:complete len:217 (+) Transcript_18368:347-997(+)
MRTSSPWRLSPPRRLGRPPLFWRPRASSHPRAPARRRAASRSARGPGPRWTAAGPRRNRPHRRPCYPASRPPFERPCWSAMSAPSRRLCPHHRRPGGLHWLALWRADQASCGALPRRLPRRPAPSPARPWASSVSQGQPVIQLRQPYARRSQPSQDSSPARGARSARTPPCWPPGSEARGRPQRCSRPAPGRSRGRTRTPSLPPLQRCCCCPAAAL